jgi:hemolysin III
MRVALPIELQREESKISHPVCNLGEEIANSVTHGIGTGLSMAGSAVLVILAAWRGDVGRIVSFSIYGSTLIIGYMASTLYHGLQNRRVKRLFRVVDHASIYLYIAGTYTPFLLLSLRGAWRWTFLIVIWGLALLGIGFKLFSVHRFQPLTTLSYLFMGWLSVIAVRELVVTIPARGVALLAIGGMVYSVGVIFYAWHKLPYNHTIWHLFVLAGSICHYLVILFYLSPIF